MPECSCEKFPTESILNTDNLKNTTYTSFTVDYIKKDFGSVEEFYKLDDKIKTIILQLYNERELDNKIVMGDNWSRKFNCTESYKLIHDARKFNIKTNNNIHMTISDYNFRIRCNELNPNNIDFDDIEKYLEDNDYIYSKNDSEFHLVDHLFKMAQICNSNGYITETEI